MDFDVEAGPASKIGRALADLARQVVSESGRYVLLDRENMVRILGEEDFAAAMRCDQTRCLVAYGRKLRAQKLGNGRVQRVGESFVLTIAITDVSSARIDGIRSEPIKGSIEDVMRRIQPTMCETVRDTLSLSR